MSSRGESDEALRLLLVGKTGAGKSATGNTILGEKKFKVSFQPESVTETGQLEKTVRHGREIQVMDSPGLFDTRKDDREIADKVVRALIATDPGPHAVLYVIRLGDKYTEEDYRMYSRLKSFLGEEVIHFMVVAFTHGDALAEASLSIGEYLQKIPPELRLVLKECDNRFVVFSNRSLSSEHQFGMLLEQVQRLGGVAYDKSPYAKMVKEAVERTLNEALADVKKKEVKQTPYVRALQEQTELAESEKAALGETVKEMKKERENLIWEAKRIVAGAETLQSLQSNALLATSGAVKLARGIASLTMGIVSANAPLIVNGSITMAEGVLVLGVAAFGVLKDIWYLISAKRSSNRVSKGRPVSRM